MFGVGGTKKVGRVYYVKQENILVNSFKALGDVNRHRIFKLLNVHQRMSASDIARKLKISRPLASQHLKILVQSQLFKREKVGQHKFYQIDGESPFVRSFISVINKFN